MSAVDKVLRLAEQQVGYIGKKSNAQLDDPKANPGGKYNKFARDLDNTPDFYNGKKLGYDYCDVTFDWLMVTCFGADRAKRLLCQPDKSLGAGVKYSANYYLAKGQYHKAGTTPQPGDQIFFGDSSSWWHTGLVVAVDSKYVSTIEGNAAGYVDGKYYSSAVLRRRYLLSDKTIKGYGRPDYSIIKEDDEMTQEQFDRMAADYHARHKEKRYNALDEIPAGEMREAVRKAMAGGFLLGGTGGKLNLSADMIRLIVMHARAGVYDT